MEAKAFVLRIAPSGVDRMELALKTNTIIIGWARAAPLLDRELDWEQFRQTLIDAYPDYSGNLRSAGSAGGHMWRFVREMSVGDYIVSPHWSSFYVARITGEAYHDPTEIEEDTAFRRPVEWLNGKKPFHRDQAPSALYSRMKTQQTSAYAHDLLAEIRAVLEGAEAGVEANFADQLTQILADAALLQMREGLMNERKFEKLVALMLERLGATTTITPRSRDVGDDVVATFKAIGITVVAQVKYHKSPQWETGPEAVDQVLSGIDKVSADVGWVVTCGRFSELARDRAKNPPGGKRVRLIEGDEFAKMLVAAGIDHIGGTLGATSAS